MSTPISTVMRRRLLIGGNVIASKALAAAFRTDPEKAAEDLRVALWHTVSLAACLHHTHPPKPKKTRRKRA